MPRGAEEPSRISSDGRARTTRAKRDALDRALLDLASFYRDVLAVQSAATVGLTNDEIRSSIEKVAKAPHRSRRCGGWTPSWPIARPSTPTLPRC